MFITLGDPDFQLRYLRTLHLIILVSSGRDVPRKLENRSMVERSGARVQDQGNFKLERPNWLRGQVHRFGSKVLLTTPLFHHIQLVPTPEIIPAGFEKPILSPAVWSTLTINRPFVSTPNSTTNFYCWNGHIMLGNTKMIDFRFHSYKR